MRPPFIVLTLMLTACSSSSTGESPAPLTEAGSPSDGATADASPPTLLSIDCTKNNPACPAMTMPPDAPDQSMFRGFADPSMRRDPVTGDLWMSYSWLHSIVGKDGTGTTTNTDVLDIHVAKSTDGGKTWSYQGPVWTAEPVAGAADGGAAPYYSSHEVSNLYPIDNGNGSVTWVGIEKYYTVEQGGNPISNWNHFVASSLLVIATASTPIDLGKGPSVRLGAAGTKSPVDVDLTKLSPDLSGCAYLAEPALTMQGNTLYLALFCASQAGPTPQDGNGFYAIFSTNPAGQPTSWPWKYEGKLATPAMAQQLDGHQLWWELDFTRKSDGTLLALVTPANQGGAGGLASDGCRALEVASLSPPAMAQGSTNGFVELADVTSSDLSGVGGAQACAYEPASSTGIIVFRYMDKSPGTPGVLGAVNATGLLP